MELLMLCHVFPQRSQSEEEDLQAENTRILHRMQSLLTYANVSVISSTSSSSLAPLYQFFCLRNARPLSATSVLRYVSEEDHTQKIRAEMLDGWEDVEGILHYQAGHFGIEKTWKLVARKYYQYLHITGRTYRWIWRRDCLYLRIGRVPVTTQSWPIPTHCWKDLSIDFVAGLPISTDWKGDSYNSILVIINWLTKMVHYKPA